VIANKMRSLTSRAAVVQKGCNRMNLVGLVAVAVGILMIVFNESMSRFTIWGQRVFWGLHFGEKMRAVIRVSCVATGIIWIVLGLLHIFGVV